MHFEASLFKNIQLISSYTFVLLLKTYVPLFCVSENYMDRGTDPTGDIKVCVPFISLKNVVLCLQY